MRTTITMTSGKVYIARGYAGAIAKAIEDGVENDMTFVPIEKDSIPTGQMFYISPAFVESVEGDA